MKLTFITWNASKAEYLEKYLDFEVQHKKIELDEIQSMSLEEIVEHKVKQAYEIVKEPVLVEDVSLEFEGLWGLPGPFIKFFWDNISMEDICGLVSGKSRKARARCMMGYYDGNNLELIEWSLGGEIAEVPAWENWFGWDKIFIPEGYNVTRAELNSEDDKKTYLQIKPIEKLKNFLEEIIKLK